ncbi:serine hydrolase [Myxococcus sp. RHSTA-1-4]|uniref:serine hydrolase domain-containing protein n=1 Tax=Myxococcus sp. RHSTA-1-4 TaxID=2874601 RepID=UPI001CBC6D3B|nr:serine hydrolase domain-containing protein [Myxococcus sp. RHSTA-1-4]MBZ4416812.1 beta-lactamase family protein [Myxococcus sp. RHSTA-1-4]
MNLLALLGASLILQVTPPEFPDTPPGRVARAWVEAVQSGDSAKIEPFVQRYLSVDPLLWTTRANYRVLMKNVHDPMGLEVGEVQARGDDVLSFILTSRRDGRRSRVTVYSDPEGREVDVSLAPVPSPEEQARFQWPDGGALGRQGTLDAIRRHLGLLAKHDRWSGVVLIAKGDKVLLSTAHGLADRAFQVPIREGTRFDLASVGKMFTAAAVAQLVDEGRVSLEDTVGKHLPDYPDAAVREKVTVRHLLTHTGGLGTLFGSPGFDATRRYTDATDMTTAFHGEPLRFEPGTDWSYSNAGFVLLGAIIERIEGRHYRDSLRERIWTPLGMTGTDIVGRDAVVRDLARIHDRTPLDPFGREPKVLDSRNYGWIGGPHGGGHSTAMDLFRFMRALRKGKLMKPGTLEAFLTPPPGSPDPNYAHGFRTAQVEGHRLIFHGGHLRADVGIFWDLDVTVIVLGNDLYDSVAGVSRPIRTLIARNAQAF